jgi:hypothetical protein
MCPTYFSSQRQGMPQDLPCLQGSRGRRPNAGIEAGAGPDKWELKNNRQKQTFGFFDHDRRTI